MRDLEWQGEEAGTQVDVLTATEVAEHETITRLQLPQPVALLSFSHQILRANLLMLWVWGALRIGERCDPSEFVGKNFFEVLTGRVNHQLDVNDERNMAFIRKNVRIASILDKVIGLDRGYSDFTDSVLRFTVSSQRENVYRALAPSMFEWEEILNEPRDYSEVVIIDPIGRSISYTAIKSQIGENILIELATNHEHENNTK